MKLLVIGSNSFSGSSFIDFALSQGFRVLGCSRSSEPIAPFLPYTWREKKDFIFRKLDLNYDLPQILEWIEGEKPEYVVNFAAQSMVAQSWDHPKDWFMTNVVSTIELHHALRKYPFLKRYVHVSTPEVYGSTSCKVSEECPMNPSTPYAVSRAAADMSLASFYAAYKFPVVTTRAANVYGPGQQLYRIIPRTILFILLGRKIELHGGGISTRSFIHIRDVAEATWQLLFLGKNGETYHISTGEMISIFELVTRICQKMNVSLEDHVVMGEERLGKDATYHLDSSKIRKTLGWKDRISLEQGLEECIEWVERHFEKLKDQNYDYIHKK